MKNQDLQAEINAIDQESAQLESGVEQSVIKKLLNNVERLASENEALKIEVQNLKDENNRLKGEQGKPDIKANKKKDGDISSETERKQAEANGEGVGDANGKKKRQRKPKLPKLKIDREQICVLDKSGLPDDLIFKGHAALLSKISSSKQTMSGIAAKSIIHPRSTRIIVANCRTTSGGKVNMALVSAR